MAEVFGILAAAAQLAQYALLINATISDIYTRVHEAGDLEKHAKQVEKLVEIICLIQKNPQVHTESVLQHLNTALDEAKGLLNLLERVSKDYTHGSFSRRYFKAITGDREKKIEKGFKRLEQEKTTLLICVEIANTDKLSNIETGVTELKAMSLARDLSTPAETEEDGEAQFDAVKDNGELVNMVLARNSRPWTSQHNSSPANDQGRYNANIAKSQTTFEDMKTISKHGDARQLNANRGDGEAKFVRCTAESTGKGNSAQKNVAGREVDEIVREERFFKHGNEDSDVAG